MSVQNQGADPVKVAFEGGAAVKESTEGTTSTTHGNSVVGVDA